MYVVEATPRQKEIEQTFTRKAMKDGDLTTKKVRSNGHPRPDGELIRKLMNQANMKPRHLAQHIGVDTAKIQLILKDVGTEINLIASLADLLKVTTQDLIKK